MNTNYLYEIASAMIQSLEAKRDYTDEGLTTEESEKLTRLNEIWESVRKFYDFKEKEIFKTIREAINSEMEIRNWSAAELSRRTQIRHATLTEYLNGNKGLSTEYIESCMRVLNLSVCN
jgi:ribosome-binding protein aMBF1 (putative translation factor)